MKDQILGVALTLGITWLVWFAFTYPDYPKYPILDSQRNTLAD